MRWPVGTAAGTAAAGAAWAGALISTAYRRDIAQARQRISEPDVPVASVSTRHGRVGYARFGTGSPVLVLHGSGGGWDQGVDWARRRLGDSHDVVAVSRFGYPGSDLPAAASTTQQADVLADVLDALGIGRTDVVALSAGSVAAVRFAIQHPGRVRSLILESPILPTRTPPPLPPVPVVRLLTRVQPVLWALTRTPVLVSLAAGTKHRDLDADGRAELAAINATLLPLAPRAAGTIFDAQTAPELISGQVPFDQLTAPTLIINARDAVLAPHADAESFARRLPHGRLLDVDSGGHVLIGNVAYLRTVVADFLAAPELRQSAY